MSYHLGVDLGATNIAVGVVDESYRIVGRASLPARAPRPAAALCDDIARACRLAAENAGLALEQISDMGVAAPGMCDRRSGELIFANNLKLLHTPLRKMMETRLHLNCFIDNDANAAAYGEFLAGGAAGFSSVLMVTLGTGVGGGILLDGKIYTGAFYAGAELGHMSLRFDGRPCNCGRRGCVETYCSATGLITTTKEAMREDPDTAMWRLCDSDLTQVDGKTAFKARKLGDKTAAAVVDLYIRQLADAISGYINFLEPQVLLLGGGVAQQGEELLNPLRKLVGMQVYDRFADRQTRIELATLGNDAGIIGAAYLSQASYL